MASFMVPFICHGWETSIISSNGLDTFSEIRPNWPHNYNYTSSLEKILTNSYPTCSRTETPPYPPPLHPASAPPSLPPPPDPPPLPLRASIVAAAESPIDYPVHPTLQRRRNTEGGRRHRRLQPAGLLLWIHPARRHHRTHRICTLTAVQEQVA
jgi:hypothetical protein